MLSGCFNNTEPVSRVLVSSAGRFSVHEHGTWQQLLFKVFLGGLVSQEVGRRKIRVEIPIVTGGFHMFRHHDT